MSVKTKICGLRTKDAIRAAVESGADYIGFVFFAASPRNITPTKAAMLAEYIPSDIIKVGVFVDPSDQRLKETLCHISLDMIQLHGEESPERVAFIRKAFNTPVIKAIAIAGQEDITRARDYQDVSDMLLFDTKAPADLKDALPGGNGLAFDWLLIAGTDWKIPWMLSGGLDSQTVAQAIKTSGAQIVDVSSGIEDHPGKKDTAKIKAFLEAVNEDNI